MTQITLTRCEALDWPRYRIVEGTFLDAPIWAIQRRPDSEFIISYYTVTTYKNRDEAEHDLAKLIEKEHHESQEESR